MRIIFLFFLILISLAPSFAVSRAMSPIGYWKTTDEVTGKAKSILHIYAWQNALYGRVVKIFPRPGYDQNEICTSCKGARQHQRIVGMIVMEGLKQASSNPAEWNDGQILDTLNGKMYHCSLTLVNHGQHLNVRDYIGLPLFGRSKTWLRIKAPSQ